MYVFVDASQVPPVVEVREADQFTSFSVVVATPAHAWVDPKTIEELAGRTGDDEWREQFAGMVAYADSKGWVDEQGRVRGHVEVQGPDGRR